MHAISVPLSQRNRQRIRIGTSGWSYDHWKGPFYPKDLPNADMLECYARSFSSVEINSCFYQLPERDTLERWRDSVPRDFVFAAKASRYVTHTKKLKDPQRSSRRFLERLAALETKLGPILFQLPPSWAFNEDRLRDFLAALASEHRYAFEFRDRRWLNNRTYRLLAEHGASLCIYDLDGYTSPQELTADFVYIRLHGPHVAYRGRYRQPMLAKWAATFAEWAAQGKSVYCYFDNDEAGHAANDALRLGKLLDR